MPRCQMSAALPSAPRIPAEGDALNKIALGQCERSGYGVGVVPACQLTTGLCLRRPRGSSYGCADGWACEHPGGWRRKMYGSGGDR
eukprot:COSAG06_NODE_5338_length_3538_cov_21.826403_2_plen_86_part_00